MKTLKLPILMLILLTLLTLCSFEISKAENQPELKGFKTPTQPNKTTPTHPAKTLAQIPSTIFVDPD